MMTLVDFKKKDSHFWIALAYGLTYFVQGLLGVIDQFLVNIDLSWKTYIVWPLSLLQESPVSMVIMIAGFLLFLDALRIFPERWQRFAIWTLMLVVLWGITGLVLYTTVVLDPHPAGFFLTNLVAVFSYTLLFTKGPPLIGKRDVLIEKDVLADVPRDS